MIKKQHFFLYCSFFEHYSVQKLNILLTMNNQDHFELLRKIDKNPQLSQRRLAEELGLSLGKLNYCLKALKYKGYVKIKNFQKNPNKIKNAYVLTPEGLSIKTALTLNFMKKKMTEYDELKMEVEKDLQVQKF